MNAAKDRQRLADDRAWTADDDQHSYDGSKYEICRNRGDCRVEPLPFWGLGPDVVLTEHPLEELSNAAR